MTDSNVKELTIEDFEGVDLEGVDIDNLYSEKEYRLEEQDLRILKSILSNEDLAKEFTNNNDEYLFVGDARSFAKKVLDHIKIYKTPPTRRIFLDQSKDDDERDEVDYIWDRIDEFEFNKNEFKYDLDKIRDRFTKSKIASLKDDFNSIDLDNDNVTEDDIRRFRRKLDDAERVKQAKRPSYIQRTMREYLPQFKEDYVNKAKNPELGKGIHTGYSYLDYVTNGLHPAQLLIICAESAAGKSMFLNNIAIQMWMQNNTIDMSKEEYTKGYNVLYFSLEMPYEACARRTMARLSDLPIYGLRDCNIKPDKISRLNSAANFIHNYPYEFEIVDIPRGVTINDIEERYNESVSNGRKPDVVAIDYLGLMEANDVSGDDWLKLGYIAGKVHEFGRVYNVPTLTAVQLNRAQKNTKDSSDLIGMHRIGRSSLIIHHADIGIQIESRKDEHTYADLIYHLIKNRDGQLGKHILYKNFKNATLKDMDEPYVPPDDDGFVVSDQVEEDLSAMLEKIGWYNNGTKE